MTNSLMFKFLISILILFCGNSVFATTYVSLSPVTTEIIYSLKADKNLLGVSSTCNYPEDVKNKDVIGDTFYVNTELLVKLKPDYIFSMSSAKPLLRELALTKTQPVYFEFTSIDEIYDAIYKIAILTNSKENAQPLINNIENKIKQYKTDNPKKILYVVQTEPFITIGNKSFITDIIKKSGHISVTSNLNNYYPNVTLEYIIKTEPDIIIVCFQSDMTKLKKIFPHTEFMYLSDIQRDIINRSGPRVYEAVKLFANLEFNKI